MAELNAGLDLLPSSTGPTRFKRIIAKTKTIFANRVALAILGFIGVMILLIFLVELITGMEKNAHAKPVDQDNGNDSGNDNNDDNLSIYHEVPDNIFVRSMNNMAEKVMAIERKQQEMLRKLGTTKNEDNLKAAVRRLNSVEPTVNALLDALAKVNISTFNRDEAIDAKLETVGDHLEPLFKMTAELKNQIQDLESTVESLRQAQVSVNMTMTNLNENQIMEGLEGDQTHVARRTCLDHFNHGHTSDGLYLIDPDGVNFGEPPITVHCSQGVTAVLHDSEEVMAIDHCSSPGCFVKNVNYKAMSINQLVTLISISEECQQTIKFGCTLAPLQDDGVDLGWWLDRNGQKQTYFDGKNSHSHLCACAANNTCLQNKQCNCDAHLPGWNEDVGSISNQSALPITAFAYGGLQHQLQRANFSIGRLQCKGTRHPIGKVKSCQDLFLLRSGSTGYQWVWDEELQSPKIVYCNYHVNLDDPNFETPVKMEKKEMAFEMTRSSESKNLITYDSIAFTIGIDEDALNKDQGSFKVSQAGLYEFRFQAKINFEEREKSSTVWVHLNGQKNRNVFRQYLSASYFYSLQQPVSVYWTQTLSRNDEVSLHCTEGKVMGQQSNPIRFSGRLIK